MSTWSNRTFQKVALVLFLAAWASILLRNPSAVPYRKLFNAISNATDTSKSQKSGEDPLYSDIVDDGGDFAAVPQASRASTTKEVQKGKSTAKVSSELPQKSSSATSVHLNPNIPAHKADQQAHATWDGYSVKPIAYIFPQYYAFKENNEIWGEGWTEWVNVKQVEHNHLGLETIKPADSIGYYDGLAFETRQRQARYLKDSGFYGMVYHHYWFAGVPVMDHVLQAMLVDGEPDVPFMLSWANEPWRARWGGLDHDTLFIDQDYGHIAEWRAHFDWCLPFFRHPNYIRSEGRIQFIVYKPEEIGHIGPQMFSAWRKWAMEEGFELDIIETRFSQAPRWNQGLPDAINEFQPHVAGPDLTRHAWSDRISRVYHRATFVCWDATPRYLGDLSRSGPQPFCHPKTWEGNIVKMLGHIKSDPNPIGTENFMFVNALNEWGEGNCLEPSVQFGDGYSKAMQNALKISEKIHVWPDQRLDKGWKQILSDGTMPSPDVCVLIRAHRSEDDAATFPMSELLDSLQRQNNPNWIALAYQKNHDGFGSLHQHIDDRFDERIRYFPIASEYLTGDQDKDAGFMAVDFMIENLTTTDPACASAKYLLVTEGRNTYAPTAFDVTSKGVADIVGLNVESKMTMFNHPQFKKTNAWNERCDRLKDLNFCYSTDPSGSPNNTDIASIFISLPKLVLFHSQRNISSYTSHPRHQGGALISDLLTSHSWTWAQADPTGEECHMMANPAYNSCWRAGHIWFDGAKEEQAGCYRPNDLAALAYENLDLQYTRENGICARFNKGRFEAEAKTVEKLAEEGAMEEEAEEIHSEVAGTKTSVDELGDEVVGESSERQTGEPTGMAGGKATESIEAEVIQ